MTDKGPIVCATDLSPSGAEAVEIAGRMAAAIDRPLHIVHVGGVEPPAEGEPSSEAERVYRERLQARHDAAQAALDQERARAEGLGPHATATLASGRPWEVLVKEAEAREASLVVVGPHGHGGPATSTRRDLTEWILGSTADRVLRHAPCPVLVGPRGEDHPHPVGGGTWLVAVDFSEPAREALRLAHRWARACDATLVALHVTHDPVMRLDPAGDDEPFPPLDSVAEEEAEHKRAELAGLVKGEVGEEIDIRVVIGEPSEQIAATAKALDARLIVMGTHGRTGLAHFFLGSTAERTLRRSPVPVLCARV